VLTTSDAGWIRHDWDPPPSLDHAESSS
jgi:hypothetical protein